MIELIQHGQMGAAKLGELAAKRRADAPRSARHEHTLCAVESAQSRKVEKRLWPAQ
jgi:hypothetical protein